MPNAYPRSTRTRVFLLHLSFWCMYFSFFMYQVSYYHFRSDGSWGGLLLNAALQTGFMCALAYINYFFFLPKVLENKQLLRYFLTYLIPFSILTLLFVVLKRYFVDGYTYQEKYFYSERFVIQLVVSSLFIVLFVSMLRFAEDWFELEAKKKELAGEKLLAELRYLKAQVNPHFLFNTLNNLYYLAYTQSPQTPEVVARLAQMMRYMIYDSNHALTPLSKEIAYMENYIQLEKLRLSDSAEIRFQVSGDPGGVQIAPLIFITFLENAFKHGIGPSGGWIRASLSLSGGVCHYEVENSRQAALRDPEMPSGIGLQNVRRRLELTYPGQYVLDIQEFPESYAVRLMIRLEGQGHAFLPAPRPEQAPLPHA
jgi:sensor histidine kinase YesM